MDISLALQGKRVRTSRGEGLVIGRVIEFGRATRAVVQLDWIQEENPRLVDAFPLSDVEIIDETTGEPVRDLPGR